MGNHLCRCPKCNAIIEEGKAMREHMNFCRDRGIRRFKTKCDPDANGRKPKIGDVRFTVTLPLENGEQLVVTMGKEGRDNLFGMLIADCHDSGEPEPEAK